MIVTTIGDLIKSLKKYPKSSHKEAVGMVWYRRKFFKDDVEDKKFLTNELFEEALEHVNDERGDELIAGQIIDFIQSAEQDAKET